MRKQINQKNSYSFSYYLIVLLIVIFSLAPIFWCFIISLTPESETLEASNNLVSSNLTFENYKILFNINSSQHQTIFNGLKNSLIISSITLIIGIPLSVITAYTFVRFNFRGKKIILNLLILTIVIPVFTTIIPIYNIFRELNLLDNIVMTSVIYISSFLPLNTWIIMNYLKTFPKELWQAAELDGLNEIQIFIKIILPLLNPIILTTSLIMFLMAWKQYIIPTILISSYQYKPITLVMSEFMTRDAIEYSMIAAGGILSIIPPIIAAIFFRKFLVKGLSLGSIKM